MVNGTANLDGCNVFSNEAQVRADRAGRPFPDLSSSAPLERYTCSPFVPLQGGGGLFVWGTATLINSAIYQNEATVGAHSEPTS